MKCSLKRSWHEKSYLVVFILKQFIFTGIPIPGSYKMSKSQTSMCMFSHLGSTCCTTGEIQGHGLIRPRVDCLQNTNKCWVFLLMSKLCYVAVKNYININNMSLHEFKNSICLSSIKLLLYFILQ